MLIEAFVGWLVEQVSDGAREHLTDWVLGKPQERALRRVAEAAILRTAGELSPGNKATAEHIARSVDQVFSVPPPTSPDDDSSTMLEVLRIGIAQHVAVLGDSDITGTGQSWAGINGLTPDVLAEKLTSHVLREILIRGAEPGALTPLAAQLNADAARLQGRQMQDALRRLTELVLSRDSGNVTNTTHVHVYGNLIFAKTEEQTSNAADFERRYRNGILSALDRVKLFGLNPSIWPQNYRLRTSYVDVLVNVTGDGRRERMPEREAESNDAFGRAPVRIESLLRDTRLVLLEGTAGSGKSSALRHLAVTALVGDEDRQTSFASPLVPFLLELRFLVSKDGLRLPQPEQFVQAVAAPLDDIKPDQWVARLLAGGKALVLVDGFDEVREEYRERVLEWLNNLIKYYPESYYVLAARDAAVKDTWRRDLRDRGFATARLTPLNPGQVDQLVTNWHKAVVEADKSGYVSQLDIRWLRRTIAARGDLAKLAATPLMCAIMCALSVAGYNVHRSSRAELYRTGLDLLLFRRDVARSIRAADWQIDPEESRELLSEIASWMLLNDQDVIPGHVVLTFIADVTGDSSRDSATLERFLQRVFEQTGILELTHEKAVVFRYPGFQDYLAARKFLRQESINYLVNNAHNGRYRDVLVMAAAEASREQGDRIIAELIDRAQAAGPAGRATWILAAECAAARTRLDLVARLAIEDALRGLLPPVSLDEAASVAQLGGPVLDVLIEASEGRELTDEEAIATIRTAALIDVDRATALFRRFRKRPVPGIQRELVAAWFWASTPERYADEVLRDARLEDCLVELQSLEFLPYLDRIENLRALSMPPETESLDLEEIAGFVNVRARLTYLSLANTAVGDFSPVKEFPQLQRLDLTGIPDERRMGLPGDFEVSVIG